MSNDGGEGAFPLLDSRDFFKDAVNPTPEEVRAWAYSGCDTWPEQDFDLFVVDPHFLPLMTELAFDDACPQQRFAIGILYSMITHNEHDETLHAVAVRAGESSDYRLRFWSERALTLLAHPDRLKHPDTCFPPVGSKEPEAPVDMDWSWVDDAYGRPATRVPEFLADLWAEDAEVRDTAAYELWSRICHQGTVYSASKLSIPALMDFITSSPHERTRVDMALLVGSIGIASIQFPKDWRTRGCGFRVGEELSRADLENCHRPILVALLPAAAVVATAAPVTAGRVYLPLMKDSDPLVRTAVGLVARLAEDPAGLTEDDVRAAASLHPEVLDYFESASTPPVSAQAIEVVRELAEQALAEVFAS